MQTINASSQQIMTAAEAGVKLLAKKDLCVPLEISIDGHLSVLNSLLNAIADGDLIVIHPHTPEEVAVLERLHKKQKKN